MLITSARCLNKTIALSMITLLANNTHVRDTTDIDHKPVRRIMHNFDTDMLEMYLEKDKMETMSAYQLYELLLRLHGTIDEQQAVVEAIRHLYVLKEAHNIREDQSSLCAYYHITCDCTRIVCECHQLTERRLKWLESA